MVASSTTASGSGATHDASPGRAVPAHLPTPSPGQPMAFALVVDGTDELRGQRECRVVLGDQGLGEEGHYLLTRKGVLQSLQQEVTDHALCLGHEGVEGVGEGRSGSRALSSASRPTWGPLPWVMTRS